MTPMLPYLTHMLSMTVCGRTVNLQHRLLHWQRPPRSRPWAVLLLSLDSKRYAVGSAAAAEAQVSLTRAHGQTVYARQQQLLILRWDAGHRCKLFFNFVHRCGRRNGYADWLSAAKDVDLKAVEAS